MRRIAFLTLSDPTGWVIDDELAVLPLARRGIKVDTIPWNRPGVDWRRYELVVIRSTWDYQHHAEEFLRTLEAIEQPGDRFCVGVQWHPETAADVGLLAGLVRAAANHRA